MGERVEVSGRGWRRCCRLPWAGLAKALVDRAPASLVWLLDGAEHAELERLAELLHWAPMGTHVVLVSTCTVYGDRDGSVCDEEQPLDLRTPHARLKAQAEAMLAESTLSWCVQRLGALYGVDDRGARTDRVEKWVTAAATTGEVHVPDPDHWRGWVHRDQAARSLWRAARSRTAGVFNVASANLTFGQAAGQAAEPFGATVVADEAVDLCDYRIDATKARSCGLLDEFPEENLATTVSAFVRHRYPDRHPGPG